MRKLFFTISLFVTLGCCSNTPELETGEIKTWQLLKQSFEKSNSSKTRRSIHPNTKTTTPKNAKNVKISFSWWRKAKAQLVGHLYSPPTKWGLQKT